MAAIDKRFGAGGKNLSPGGSNGTPTLADVLRDIADDLTGLQGGGALASTTTGAALSAPVAVTIGADLSAPPAATVGVDIPAFTDPPSAAEMTALRTFVNALKADVATLRGEVATAFTRINQAKVDHGNLRGECGTAFQRVNQIRVDLLDVRTKTPGAYTLKTTKV